MDWYAHVTVATIVEHNGRFLFVEELKGGRLVLNQPAGHLEPRESLQQAAVRETLEETGCDVELTGVTGIYLYTAPSNGVTYQRICFTANLLRHDPERALDTDISGIRWLTHAELQAESDHLRSELVMHCLDDYLSGERFPLSIIRAPM